MTLFRSLRNRPFALIWSGQTVSRLGDSLYRIALSWWVLEKTGSAAIMGTVLIFSFTPMIIFSLIGGVAVDRFSRLKVMLASDLLRGLVVGVVALLAISRNLEVWHIYTASVVFGFVDAFFQPAFVAVLPEIVHAETLPSANSLNSLSGQFATIAGPAIGAALVGLGGTPTAFALDGLSFFISAACLMPLLKIPLQARAGIIDLKIWQELKIGLRVVLDSPWLWITIAIAALANVTLSGPYSVALPFLVKGNLHQGVEVLGLFYSIFSAGSVIGAIWLGHYTRLRRRGLIGYLGWLLDGLMLLTFGLPVRIEIILLATLVFGITNSGFSLVWTNTLQEMVPGDLLGRVSSIDNLGSFVLLPVGFGLAGILTDKIGAPLVFICGGLATALLALLGLLHPAIRNLD